MTLSKNHHLVNANKPVRVLFIPAWYPPKDGSSAFGTFVREHVRSAALYDHVAVLVNSPSLRQCLESVEGVTINTAQLGATFGVHLKLQPTANRVSVLPTSSTKQQHE